MQATLAEGMLINKSSSKVSLPSSSGASYKNPLKPVLLTKWSRTYVFSGHSDHPLHLCETFKAMSV